MFIQTRLHEKKKKETVIKRNQFSKLGKIIDFLVENNINLKLLAIKTKKKKNPSEKNQAMNHFVV